MKAPSFYSDPHVQFLSQLLEEIGEGGLQVPRFQRPLVWDWERRLELLRSIRDGIPIGAIMVWRTNSVIIECYEKLGPHKLAPPAGSTRQYILDGVQRLSTLYGALLKPPTEAVNLRLPLLESDDVESDDEHFDEAGLFDVFFDLSANDFISPDNMLDAIGPLMPLSIVFDSIALLRFQRTLAEAGAESAIKTTDELARAFRDYKMPVIPITTDDINLATRTFQRINSQGARMSETHMVHALTWNPSFDLQHRLADLRRKMLSDIGWGGLDDDPVLKACKAALGLDVYKTSADELSRALLAHPEILEKVFSAIGRAASFLMSSCGVGSPELTPYALQIVVLAEAFRVLPEPSEHEVELLRAWFWMTTYGELFASMSGDRVQVAISDIHFTVLTGVGKWTWKRPFEERPLRQNFDFRAARAKAFALQLAAAQDHAYQEPVGTVTLNDLGRKALPQLVPVRLAGRAAFSSPGNRFLLAPSETGEFRDTLLNGNLSWNQMEAHRISWEALQLLQMGHHDAFIRRRAADISRDEHLFLQPLLARYSSAEISNFSSNLEDIFDDHDVKLLKSGGEGHFVFRLGSLNTPITVQIMQEGDVWAFYVSHAIQTPVQIGPYWTSRPYEDSPQDALRRAISGLESYYSQATRLGFEPSESWLVPSGD